ncbi:MAG: FKBP-type peptidyl-prolyl cis-trans isomerase [Puia sp.]|nr:FKBP-type peptidyl-prolyl cis-trans isomerase [Puia sp.]
MNVPKKVLVSFLVAPACLFATAQVKNTATAKKPVPAVSLKTTTDSLSYAIGLSVANFYKQQNITNINSALVTKAINDITRKNKPLLTDEQANACISGYIQKTKAAQASVAKKAGEAFLANNKNKPGVVTLPSGLQYLVIKDGDGPKPGLTDKIKCHYHGTLIDGRVFDSSVDRGEPIELTVNGVIPGWTEALQLMSVGSKWKLFIPSNLAYGDQQAGPLIAPGSTLIFDVELLAIEK